LTLDFVFPGRVVGVQQIAKIISNASSIRISRHLLVDVAAGDLARCIGMGARVPGQRLVASRPQSAPPAMTDVTRTHRLKVVQ